MKAITPQSLTELSAVELAMVDPVVEAVSTRINEMFAEAPKTRKFEISPAGLKVKGKITAKVASAVVDQFVGTGWKKSEFFDGKIIIAMKSKRGRKAKTEAVEIPADADADADAATEPVAATG